MTLSYSVLTSVYYNSIHLIPSGYMLPQAAEFCNRLYESINSMVELHKRLPRNEKKLKQAGFFENLLHIKIAFAAFNCFPYCIDFKKFNKPEVVTSSSCTKADMDCFPHRSLFVYMFQIPYVHKIQLNEESVRRP